MYYIDILIFLKEIFFNKIKILNFSLVLMFSNFTIQRVKTLRVMC